MNRLLAAAVFISVSALVCGQAYYLPFNILQAYTQKGTRDFSGKPGEHYFQNGADYNISVNFDPESGELVGSEEVVYYNNSPDSIYYFVIHLHQDILKKGNPRDEAADPDYLTEGMVISSLKVNDIEASGENSPYYFKKIGTNLYIGLNYFIESGDKVDFSIKWETIIPKSHFHRYGNYGKGNWFVAYWYPQISVYDDIDGWDRSNYTGLYEMYNDFNSYNVEITVPSGYLVWATGNWLNAETVLKKKFYDRYQQADTSDEVVHIISKNDLKKSDFLTKKRSHTYTYFVDSVPDFAFAIAPGYLWDAVSTMVDSSTRERTTLHVVYPESSLNGYKHIAAMGAKSVNHFSHEALQISYPYSQVTIFNGGGGMEFPMMVNMRNKSPEDNLYTAMHELFHGYFPFYTGVNERKYAWLDEGLTCYLPIETEALINEKLVYSLQTYLDHYTMYAGNDQETTLMTPSLQTRGYSYYHQAYNKSTAAFAVLEHYLGRELFREGIRVFINNWKYKHPTGYDFIYTLQNTADEDLSWLINPWFFEHGWADLSLKDVKADSTMYRVEIDNAGGLPVPIRILVIPKQGDSYFITKNVDVWKGTQKVILNIPMEKPLKRIELGGLNIPDKVVENNYYFFSD